MGRRESGRPQAFALWWRVAVCLERQWRLGPPFRSRLWLYFSCSSSLASHGPRLSPSLSGSRRRVATTSISIFLPSPVSAVEPTKGRTPEVRWFGMGPGQSQAPALVLRPVPGVAETPCRLWKEYFGKVNLQCLRGFPRKIKACTWMLGNPASAVPWAVANNWFSEPDLYSSAEGSLEST